MTKSKVKDNVCPHCLSKLRDEDGILTCKGDRLRIWEKDFKRYEKMTPDEKKNYLISFSDSEKFIEMYEKWSYVDPQGTRSNFTCGYSNRIFSPVPETRIVIPDPLQVNRIERILKRPLTEEELYGEEKVFVDGKEVVIESMVFPDDF